MFDESYIWTRALMAFGKDKGFRRNAVLRKLSYEGGILIACGLLKEEKVVDGLVSACSKNKLAPMTWILKNIDREIDRGIEAFEELYSDT